MKKHAKLLPAVLSVLFLGIFLTTSSVSFAYMRRLSLNDLKGLSDAIVEGTVTAISNEIVNGIPFTNVDIAIADNGIFKGSLSNSVIRISYVGGALDQDRILTSSNSPSFEKGENVIVFVREFADDATYSLVGGPQGKFIENDGKVYSHKNEKILGLDENGYIKTSSSASLAQVTVPFDNQVRNTLESENLKTELMQEPVFISEFKSIIQTASGETAFTKKKSSKTIVPSQTVNFSNALDINEAEVQK